MFFIGLIIGGSIGYIIAAFMIGVKSNKDNVMDAFDDGVSYGLNLGREYGAIIATNKDEIMVQYKDGMMKRFREVNNDQES